MPWFKIVAVVNDGQMDLSPEIFKVSRVIRDQATAESQLAQAKLTRIVSLNIPCTAHDLRTLERYILHVSQSDCQQLRGVDLATLVTVAELALELEIPKVADLVPIDITQTLIPRINGDNRDNLKDYPWLKLCHIAKKTNLCMLLYSTAWLFLSVARATHSREHALWAFQIGRTVREETGLDSLWTFGLYLCVVWGAFKHVNAPILSSAIASAVYSNQIALESMMGCLKTPQLCEVHDSRVCVGEEVRRQCADHWQAVWKKAYQGAREKVCSEYKGTNIGGPERDVIRMVGLIRDALPMITAEAPFKLVSPECDRNRLRALDNWVLVQEGTVKSNINHLGLGDIMSLRIEGL